MAFSRLSPALRIALAAAVLAAAGFALVHVMRPAPGTPVRARLCRDCAAPDFALAMPRHGIVLALTGSFSFGWEYIVFDQERQMLIRGHAPSRPPGGVPAGPDHAEVRLSDADSARLAALVAGIWAMPDRLPGSGAMDASWQLWLSDGPYRRYEAAAGLPSGAAAPLAAALSTLADAHLPARPKA